MNDVDVFVSEIHEAFQKCGAVPVFSVTGDTGSFRANRITRIHTEVVPSIYESRVREDRLSDFGFQDDVNQYLGATPVCFDGVDDLAIKLTTGKFAVIRGIRWSYEINRIDRLEMNHTGAVGIMGYQFTQNIVGEN
jgi:hypothetical protein